MTLGRARRPTGSDPGLSSFECPFRKAVPATTARFTGTRMMRIRRFWAHPSSLHRIPNPWRSRTQNDAEFVWGCWSGGTESPLVRECQLGLRTASWNIACRKLKGEVPSHGVSTWTQSAWATELALGQGHGAAWGLFWDSWLVVTIGAGAGWRRQCLRRL